ncbi:alpha/beta fold hydrolase [Kangiella spongicola]|uniref:Alpha/beta hydrolase n=1 Tax=Kangiella spongicola TaxID=796379 RepID=A0A318D4E3_9GAMM|nr:alpha/beta hydrolase [Kangiella spongicola]PXF64120.1 alpha/beta hydrolase [Kangiella spongicola]
MKQVAAWSVALLLSVTNLCVMAKADKPAIPLQSHLTSVNGHQLHYHQKGQAEQKPLLILLSGPTDNWHSDSAWWILAQNYLSNRSLADSYQSIAIDRAGQAWSKQIEAPSYRQFASDLEAFLLSEEVIGSERELVFVAFASSNLSLQLLLNNPKLRTRTRGVVLIDPDVLTPHSIQHYTSETEGYKEGWQGLKDYIKAGKYEQRIEQKLKAEREHLMTLIPKELEDFMDWDYYDAVEAIRNTRDYQIHKFLEASVYKEDLEAAVKHPLDSELPLVVLDTDFESAYLATIEDEAVKASIAKWRKEGIEWYFELAKTSDCGAYWPVDTKEHLLMMSQPELIEQAIEKVLTCSK